MVFFLYKHFQEEERRQREAYEKRMQELKASFLDETSQMSGGGGDSKLDVNDETYVKNQYLELLNV